MRFSYLTDGRCFLLLSLVPLSVSSKELLSLISLPNSIIFFLSEHLSCPSDFVSRKNERQNTHTHMCMRYIPVMISCLVRTRD